MSLGFPTTHAVGDTHTVGSRTWRWNGTGWEKWEMNPIPSSSVTPSSFMLAIEAQPWIETLVTSYPSAVPGNHIGVLLNYI